ncbi:hypothetical protein MHM_04110 [Candidatus Mycoplasma haemominutum 'Birmingham 1']|uniref:Uncharacterized protein n=1 Tax=Candidatus Mycoplasma haematominutum 'Birmingham 1' TaxID=1116213 RepID=G8C3N1_9MOLU|nr:hypothetical protein MHM_04110 [Candidatus Mycoplasma haematominutum 'Birmingham 1']
MILPGVIASKFLIQGLLTKPYLLGSAATLIGGGRSLCFDYLRVNEWSPVN